MSKNELIQLLVKERDHHFQHPYEVGSKMALMLSGNCFAVLAAVILGEVEPSYSIEFVIPIMLLASGLAFASWGIFEHSSYHAKQRNYLEKAIELLIKDGSSVEEILRDHWSSQIGGQSVPLIAAEPDKRRPLAYHDTKIILGLLCQVAATVAMIFAVH